MTKTLHTAIAGALLLGIAPAAWASYPSHYEMKKVKYLAHELYEGAEHLYDKSSYYARRGDRRERDATHYLHQLAKASHRFYGQVEDYYRQPRRTEREFRRLIHAYYLAVDGFHYLRAYDHYREDFRCLTQVMDKLVHYYGGYGAYDRRGGYDRRDYRYEKDYKYRDYKYRDYKYRNYKSKDPHYYPSKGEKVLYLLHRILDH